MRWTRVGLAIALCAPGLLRAQADSVRRRYDATLYDTAARAATSYDVPAWRRTTVHWGKWLAAGAAAAFTVMGAHEHGNSNREYGRLLELCRADNADCALGSDGRYRNADAEHLYQSSIDFDRRARTRLLLGQASLLVAAGLFIADLRHHQEGPENKPFAPLEVSGDPRAGGARVGIRMTF